MQQGKSFGYRSDNVCFVCFFSLKIQWTATLTTTKWWTTWVTEDPS